VANAIGSCPTPKCEKSDKSNHDGHTKGEVSCGSGFVCFGFFWLCLGFPLFLIFFGLGGTAEKLSLSTATDAEFNRTIRQNSSRPLTKLSHRVAENVSQSQPIGASIVRLSQR
jgi:hypothetical protein